MPEWLTARRKNNGLFALKDNLDENTPGRYERVMKTKKESVKSDAVLTEMYEYLSLFRKQHLDICGDIYCKVSKFLRSRKYYAELRGCTMVIYKNFNSAQEPKLENDSVLAVLLIMNFQVEILQTNDSNARIFIHAPMKDMFHSLYLKVPTGTPELQQWRMLLARARSVNLPSLQSLTVESIIGQGGGGKVFMVHWNDDNRYYALKVINKNKTFLTSRAIRHVASERYLMEQVGHHPFLLRMEFAFQTQNNLFIGTPLCTGGDLATYIRKHGLKLTAERSQEFAPDCVHSSAEGKTRRRKKYYGRLSEDTTRMTMVEIILGLRHLHRRGIVYRDLKPENVLIDGDGHLKIGDFGLAKHLHMNHTGSGYLRTGSICGTRNYLPPEMLYGKMYSMEADMWSLGVMLYRMLCGCFPFDAPRTKEVFKLVRHEEVSLPKVLSPQARSLLAKLLAKEPRNRPTIDDAMNHPFFAGIDFSKVLQKRSSPPIANVDVGNSPIDVLENFEVSKLQAVTIGEVVSKAENLQQTVEDKSLPTTDPKGRLIGFEYVVPKPHAVPLEPIEIARKNGLLARIVSIDSEGLLSPLRSGV